MEAVATPVLLSQYRSTNALRSAARVSFHRVASSAASAETTAATGAISTIALSAVMKFAAAAAYTKLSCVQPKVRANDSTTWLERWVFDPSAPNEKPMPSSVLTPAFCQNDITHTCNIFCLCASCSDTKSSQIAVCIEVWKPIRRLM